LKKRKNKSEINDSSLAARSRNEPTVNAILSAAIRILALEGYTRFTLRNIASRVGLRLAALQHYFPSKREMLKAAIQGAIERWDEPTSRLMRATRSDSRSRLRSVIKLHLGSCVDELTGGFFVALWALTAHDHDALELLKETYRIACERFAILISEVNPTLSAAEASLRAIQVLTLLEGATITAGPRKQDGPSAAALEKRLVETALSIATRVD
jgi:AcrR family transcriptional regulator